MVRTPVGNSLRQPKNTAEQLGSIVERFDHVSIAVHDIEATATLIDLLGGRYFDGGVNAGGDFRWVQYDLPGTGRLELIAAIDPDPEHFITRFLTQRGEGLHHLTFKVRNIREAADQAVERGFTVTGYDDSDSQWKEAFLHPKSANGVLIQLAEFSAKE